MLEDGTSGAPDSTSQSKKTRSVTFRLDSTVIDELQSEADNKEISLNVLVPLYKGTAFVDIPESGKCQSRI